MPAVVRWQTSGAIPKLQAIKDAAVGNRNGTNRVKDDIRKIVSRTTRRSSSEAVVPKAKSRDGSSALDQRGAEGRRRWQRSWTIETLEDRVVPATIAVLNSNDAGPDSLRAAIDLANAAPAQDTITFAASVTGTITLRSALPDLSTAMILSGPGASVLTLACSSDAATPEFRILNVTAGAEVAISGLTISGGRLSAGGGGGIANSGTLTVIDSTLSGNSTGSLASIGGGIGAGILNSGTMTVVSSTFSGNSVIGIGGGVANSGTLTISESTFSGNAASRSAFFASSSSGGGIANLSGTTTITNSTFTGNSADGTGGGITNLSGTMTIADSTLNGNSADEGYHSSGIGGGIANYGTLTVVSSTLSGNSVRGSGGGIHNSILGSVTITNSTLHGNSADRGGGVYSYGTGGGILNSGTMTITNSTLSGNSADQGGGGISNGGSLTTTTSLFANSQGGNLNLLQEASFVSRGHNLFSDSPAVALAPTDLVNTNPLLGPLADNGGPTQTMALLPGSPAIDAGRAMAGVAVDQRGIPRPTNAAPDIGAFESRGFTIVIVSGNHQSATSGSTFPLPLVVRIASAFDEPVAGGRVRFAAPTTGASASFTVNPAPIDASGQASVVATANGLIGSYAVTAKGSGAAMSPAFALENLLNPPPVVAPTVLGVQRYGFHAQPTVLVLRFSSALDPARAQNLANYQIVTLGGRGRGGSRVGQLTRVRAAVYDPTTLSVTLFPDRRLDPRNTYQLTVRGTGPGGLASPTGVFLDGGGTGRPDSDFVRTIDRSTLAGSSAAYFNLIRGRWATRGGIVEGVSARAIDVLAVTGRLSAGQHK